MRRSAIHEQRSIHDYEVIKSCPKGQFIASHLLRKLLASFLNSNRDSNMSSNNLWLLSTMGLL
jgi:hypothetical protein